MKDYFRDFYFYPFDHSEHTCFVYSRFVELDYRRREDPGVALYRYLENKVRLDVRGSKVISDSKLIDGIDEIVGTTRRR